MSCSPENNCLVIEVSACHLWQVLPVFQIFIFLSPKQILFSSQKRLNNTGRNWFLICPFISLLFSPCAFCIEVTTLEIVSSAHHPLGSTRHQSCLTLGPARQKSTSNTPTPIPLGHGFHLILKIIPIIPPTTPEPVKTIWSYCKLKRSVSEAIHTSRYVTNSSLTVLYSAHTVDKLPAIPTPTGLNRPMKNKSRNRDRATKGQKTCAQKPKLILLDSIQYRESGDHSNPLAYCS